MIDGTCIGGPKAGDGGYKGKKAGQGEEGAGDDSLSTDYNSEGG